MIKERTVKVTFLNEVSDKEALNMLARDIARKLYEIDLKEAKKQCQKEETAKAQSTLVKN